ncbi:trehalose-phosphatase [Chryseolinea serpens]|uniref:Trehalose 6-phosphate phosphatase n=1 Tax=Chryseolinea serpens TaxID=947013 RepID=A0A1M5XU53_9BACT|nr:trehalose-phosphatase [Chryseolinea serpens]SHI03351.1 trehalose-phosphatase [Chryseolinea serpens]
MGGHRPELLIERQWAMLEQKARESERRSFFLDYDGTLAPFQTDPAKADPTAEVLLILERLCHNPANQVVIVSGRDAMTLDRWFGTLRLTKVAEHGAFISRFGEAWQALPGIDLSWKERVRSLMEDAVALYPLSSVEEKERCLVWHYRRVTGKSVDKTAHHLLQQIARAIPQTVEVMAGKKIVEVKPAFINKGTALRMLALEFCADFVITVGDDKTDEAMFEVSPGFTIKVGPGATAARYRISGTRAVLQILKRLAGIPPLAGMALWNGQVDSHTDK